MLDQGFFNVGQNVCPMEIPLKGLLGIPRRQPDSEDVKLKDSIQAFMIVKNCIDDEFKTLTNSLKRKGMSKN